MNPSFLPGLVAFPAGPLTARSPSALVLIATNLVPVFGVFFAGWDVGSIMAIYWLENVAIGFLNIVKMLLARGDRAILPARIALAAFFAVHYGIFTLVHGLFVFLIFQKDGIFGGGGGGGPMAHAATSPFAAMGGAIQAYGLAFLALFGSHLFSLFANYLGRGEYREKGVQAVMMQPYGRIVVLHLTIILGAFVTMALGSPKPVILLVFLKTYADVFFHLKEHNKGTAGSLAET